MNYGMDSLSPGKLAAPQGGKGRARRCSRGRGILMQICGSCSTETTRASLWLKHLAHSGSRKVRRFTKWSSLRLHTSRHLPRPLLPMPSSTEFPALHIMYWIRTCCLLLSMKGVNSAISSLHRLCGLPTRRLPAAGTHLQTLTVHRLSLLLVTCPAHLQCRLLCCLFQFSICTLPSSASAADVTRLIQSPMALTLLAE